MWRRNPFNEIALGLAHSREVLKEDSWFDGPNAVLLRRGLFVPASPADHVDCPMCGARARVRDGVAHCGECDVKVRVDPRDLRIFRFDHAGMAAFMAEELGLTHHNPRGAYDCFRKGGRVVYYVPREGDVKRSELLGQRHPIIVYGSANPAPSESGDVEVCCFDTLFDVSPRDGIVSCPEALGVTDAGRRPTVILGGDNERAEARRLLLGKFVFSVVRRLARAGRDFDAKTSRFWYERFLNVLSRKNEKLACDRKTVENAVRGLCGEGPKPAYDEDFAMCWAALRSGEAKSVLRAMDRLRRKAEAARSRRVPPESLLASFVKFGPDGHYPEDEPDPNSPDPHDIDDPFFQKIYEDIDGI